MTHAIHFVFAFLAAHHWSALLSFLGPVIFGAINQCYEDFTRFQIQAPAATAINSGDLILFGSGSKTMVGIAQTAQVASGTAVQDDNSGFITVQVSGAVNLSVSGFVQKSPSAGAAINRGDPVYASGGTKDVTSGVTTGASLDADTTGVFVGLAMDPVVAGATTTIRVILKNGLGS